MIKKISFDASRHNFINIFEKYFNTKLYNLHKKFTFERKFSETAGGTEEFSLISKTYDDLITRPSFGKLWKSFVIEIIKPYFDNRTILVQKLPSFRVFPSKHSVKYVDKITEGYNKHLDSEPPYYHPVFETNFWIPLIECDFLNDFYYQDKKKDWYRRADTRIDELFVFGSDVVHGNRVHNESPNTRCSIDFKALALDDYDINLLTDRIVLKRCLKFKQKEWYSTKHYYMEM